MVSTTRSLTREYMIATDSFNRKNRNFAPRIAFYGEESSFFAASSVFSGYGARYLESRTGRWLSADPAMGEYIPSPGQDTAKLPGLGGIYNTVNLHVYHYAGNNPVKYTDPDGNDFILSVYKSAGKMDVTRTPIRGTPAYDRGSVVSRNMDVVTNVVRNLPDRTSISDTSRVQESGQGNYTNPTQMTSGIYSLGETRAPKSGNSDGRYGTGEQGIAVNFSQFLAGVDQLSLEQIEGLSYQDSGYMIHITPLDYTNGCIGIQYDPNDPQSKKNAIKKMEYIVNQYKDAIKNGEQAKIIIMD